MTERSIFSGMAPRVVIRAGLDVVVKGWENDRVLAESSGNWGLQIKRKKERIEVQVGGNGQVLVPFGSSVKVYAGKNASVEDVQGTVSVVGGWDVRVERCGMLAHASAGRAMDIDCRQIDGYEIKLSAGWHLRCFFRELKDVLYLVDDLNGKWQLALGDGSTLIRLRAGGDVTLFRDQPVVEAG
jgi:hypothetical protein